MSWNPEDILSKLTTGEKVNLTAGSDFWHTYPIPRLDIPKVRLSDGPNGLRGTKFFKSIPSGCFPCGTSLGATFDKSLLRDVGELMAQEARAKGVHVMLGPTINIQRSPLGGRGFESFSEDPFLSGLVCAAVVNGVQSKDILATIKHFVCNDLEDRRLASNSIVTERALREVYLKPFEIAIRDSKPACVMTSYNKVNGEHASDSEFLLKKVLRGDWKFDGLVMSDWCGTYSINQAYRAGMDLEMPGLPRFRKQDTLLFLEESNGIDMDDVDDCALRVLKMVHRTLKSGVPSDGAETTENNTPKTSARLRSIAAQGIVLLKNETNLLPLSKSDDVAVIGPNAFMSAYCGGGSASLRPYYTVTPFEGICNVLGSTPETAIGCFSDKKIPQIPLKHPETGKPGYVAKMYLKPHGFEGDRILVDEHVLDTTRLHFYDYTHPKIHHSEFYAVLEGTFTPEESGDYVFGTTVVGACKIYLDGELIIEHRTSEDDYGAFFTENTVEKKTTLPLEAKKTHRIKVEFDSAATLDMPISEECGGGAVSFGCHRIFDPKEEIAKAVKVAQSHDKVILCIGLHQEWESEGFDRPNMDLPPHMNELVDAILEANPNTVIVNQSGTPVEMPWISKATTLLQAWFGGNELGNAIGDVIFGDVNPSGRLPLTFPIKCKDNPAYLTFRTDGGNVVYGEDIYVGYKYYEALEREVMFPFGHGLSYTTFQYDNVEAVLIDSKLQVSLQVTNTGARKGSEVVQIYIEPIACEAARPVKEFKDFGKVTLEAGESTPLKFEISSKDAFSYWDGDKKSWCLAAGEYHVCIAKSSADVVIKKVIKLDTTSFWRGI